MSRSWVVTTHLVATMGLCVSKDDEVDEPATAYGATGRKGRRRRNTPPEVVAARKEEQRQKMLAAAERRLEANAPKKKKKKRFSPRREGDAAAAATQKRAPSEWERQNAEALGSSTIYTRD